MGHTRFDLFAQSLGCHGEQVDKPEDVRPALELAKEAIKNGKPASVNVGTCGSAGTRVSPVTAMGFTLPLLIWAITR